MRPVEQLVPDTESEEKYPVPGYFGGEQLVAARRDRTRRGCALREGEHEREHGDARGEQSQNGRGTVCGHGPPPASRLVAES